MATRVFLDTNVILDIIDSHRPSHQNAIKLWKKLVYESVEIVISEDMLSTIFYINEDKRYTLEFFQAIQSKWNIMPFGKNVLEKAVLLSLEKDLDLEDMLQCLCAKEHSCDVLITNDKSFCDCGVKVSTIEEFLS